MPVANNKMHTNLECHACNNVITIDIFGTNNEPVIHFRVYTPGTDYSEPFMILVMIYLFGILLCLHKMSIQIRQIVGGC